MSSNHPSPTPVNLRRLDNEMESELDDVMDITTKAGLTALYAEVARLRAEVDELRQGAVHSPSSAARSTEPEADQPVDRRSALRRGALLAAAAATGAVGLVATSASPAAAANGDGLVLGNNAQSATAETGVTITGTNPKYGLAVTDNGLGSVPDRAAVVGHAKAMAFQHGVLGVNEGPAGTAAVYGTAVSGRGGHFRSTTGNGVHAVALGVNSVGVHVTATNHMVLVGLDGSPPELDTTAVAGTLRSEADGGDESRTRLWSCVVAGAPGVWREVAGPGTAGSLHALDSPARLYDSRPGTLPAGGVKSPLPANGTRNVLLNSNAAIPDRATALLVNVLLVNAASGAGNFTIWPYARPKPLANTMVWGGNAGRFCSMALVTTNLGGLQCQVHASLKTDLVIDCVGYYQ